MVQIIKKNQKNSNTTLVKVNPILRRKEYLVPPDSNTTLVKVNLCLPAASYFLLSAHSNTTLVKVNLIGGKPRAISDLIQIQLLLRLIFIICIKYMDQANIQIQLLLRLIY